MPRKIRQLLADLKKAGFADRGGKGSHRNFIHAMGQRVTLSGQEGHDAKSYQEREVREQIAASIAAGVTRKKEEKKDGKKK